MNFSNLRKKKKFFFHISSSLKLGDVLQCMVCHNLIGKFGNYSTDIPYHNCAFRVSEIQYTFLCQARLSCNLHFVFLSTHFKSTRVTIGIPWQSRGQDSMLSLPRAWFQSLVRKLRAYKSQYSQKKKVGMYQLYLPKDTCHRQNAKHFTLISQPSLPGYHGF